MCVGRYAKFPVQPTAGFPLQISRFWIIRRYCLLFGLMNSRNEVHVQFAVKVDPPKPKKKSLRRPTAPDEGAADKGNRSSVGKHVQFSGASRSGKSGVDDGGLNATGSTLGTAASEAAVGVAIPQRTKTRLTKEGVPVFGCPVSAARLGRRPASASNIRLAHAESAEPERWCIPTGDLVNRDYALIDMDLEISSKRKDEWSKTERPHTVRKVDERPEYLHAFRPKVERTEYWRPFTTSGPVYKPPPPAPPGNAQPWSKACRDDDVDARAVPHSVSNMSRESFVRSQMPRAPVRRDRVQVSAFAAASRLADELGSGSRPTSKVLPSQR